MPSGDTSVECISKPTPPKPSGPAPTASPAAAVQSPPPKEECKKKKPEKKGNSWRKKYGTLQGFIMNPFEVYTSNKTVLVAEIKF